MDVLELDRNPSPSVEGNGPRTATVLVFIAAFAIILSWVCIYAVTNALIAADVITPFPHDADPRPRWMLNAFIGFFGILGLLGLVFRWLSHRQIRRIDSMADVE